MRLLSFDPYGNLQITSFDEAKAPPYAILSHTWGADSDEVTYTNVLDGTYQYKDGYNKIYFCGKQALQHSLQYFWVDTCCIDKSNHAEHHTAINSMFELYQRAERCYVFLEDVSCRKRSAITTSRLSPQFAIWCRFWNARWFTRGWTLQELIAPPSVEFFSAEWVRLGDKVSLEPALHAITGIPKEALRGAPLSRFSYDERVSWIGNRKTRYVEDKAYAMLGILGISMPFPFAEGEDRAFYRLKVMFMKQAEDSARAKGDQTGQSGTSRGQSLDTSSQVPEVGYVWREGEWVWRDNPGRLEQSSYEDARAETEAWVRYNYLENKNRLRDKAERLRDKRLRRLGDPYVAMEAQRLKREAEMERDRTRNTDYLCF